MNTKYIIEEVSNTINNLESIVNETEIINPYGFIYVTTNMINDKKYIGQKIFNKIWNNYLGSGVYFLKAIKKYGRENFNREIIAIAYSKEELDNLEIEFIRNHNAVESDDYYNLVSGGGTTTGLRMSEEARKKISERTKGENHPLYGTHCSEETKKKISEANKGRLVSEETRMKISLNHPDVSGENHPMYDKHLSDETKQKLSLALKGEANPLYGKPFSEEHRKKLSDAEKGEKNHNYGKYHPELSNKQVAEIREKFATGDYTKTKLAKEYLVSRATINNVIYFRHAYAIKIY